MIKDIYDMRAFDFLLGFRRHLLSSCYFPIDYHFFSSSSSSWQIYLV